VPAAPPRFTVHRLDARAATVLTYPLRPVVRGVHRVGPLAGRVVDPLGLAAFDRELAGSDRLLVLPRVVGLRGLPPALATGAGTPGAALAHQGQGSSDVLVRPWRHGDELRRVHWRSTARHDELMVRLEERPWRGGLTVLLDRRDIAHRGRGAASSLEFAVGTVASVCVHLHACGERVTVLTEDGRDLLRAAPTTVGTGVDPLLDALAALRPSARSNLGAPVLAGGGDLLAVLGAVTPGELEPLLARPGGGHAVLLDTATWDPTGPAPDVPAPDVPAPDVRAPEVRTAAAALRRAGWHVAVAAAGDTPNRVWDRLVTGVAPDAPPIGAS
jgi:uncharacterized protein (DUF58 family)